jgi:hypothetical protein
LHNRPQQLWAVKKKGSERAQGQNGLAGQGESERARQVTHLCTGLRCHASWPILPLSALTLFPHQAFFSHPALFGFSRSSSPASFSCFVTRALASCVCVFLSRQARSFPSPGRLFLFGRFGAWAKGHQKKTSPFFRPIPAIALLQLQLLLQQLQLQSFPALQLAPAFHLLSPADSDVLLHPYRIHRPPSFVVSTSSIALTLSLLAAVGC